MGGWRVWFHVLAGGKSRYMCLRFCGRPIVGEEAGYLQIAFAVTVAGAGRC